MPEHGPFFWNQLVTTDQKTSGDFYCGLLGWGRREVDACPFGACTLFQNKGKDVGGMMNPTTTDFSRSRPPWWQAFVADVDADVDVDVDACASRVTGLGGTVIEPPHDVPGVGRACMVADPAGAAVLLMTPLSQNG